MKPLGKISNETSEWLDLIRAIAAVIVFVGHLRAFCLESNSVQLVPVNLFMIFFYFFTGLGHSAVIVFFVLSGFLIGGSVLNEIRETGALRVKAYLIARLVRIHSVLIPVLLLGGLIDWIGLTLIKISAVYEHAHFPQLLWWNVGEQLSIKVFFANVACLQTIVSPVYGSNGPLWSLANEFWYYLLFPALVMGVWPNTTWGRRVMSILLGGVLLVLLGANRNIYFLFWLAGVGVRVTPAGGAPPTWVAVAMFSVALVAIRLPIQKYGIEAVHADALIAITFSCLLWGLMRKPVPMPRWMAKVGKQAALSSYTLYVAHFPLSVFFAAVMIKVFARSMPGNIYDPASWAIYAAFILIIGFLCFLISMITERKYVPIKKFLNQFV